MCAGIVISNELTYMDPRHAQRIKTIQNLFALSFDKLTNNLPYPDDQRTKEIRLNVKKIDSLIQEYAQKYPLLKIAKTDLAILRLSIYELLIERKEPEKVVIDEAVELAKELSGDKAYGFVNAVLGKVLTNINTKKS